MGSSDRIREALGVLLREHRQDCGITAEQVGIMLRLSTGTVYAYEKARTSVSLCRFFELAAIYKADPVAMMSLLKSRLEEDAAAPSGDGECTNEGDSAMTERFGLDIVAGAGRIRNPEVRQAVLNLLAELVS